MSLLKIATRSIQQRGLSSFMTALSMALGVALVVAVLVFEHVIDATFGSAAQGYNIIVGAKGGRLELVLNTVFHLGQPIENIPWNFYKEFTPEGVTGANKPGKYASVIDVAVPYCLGDNYKGFRVVGTTPALFDKLGYGFEDSGAVKTYKLAAGDIFKPDDYYGAVVGAVAARRTGLKPGDEFQPTHGVTTEEGQGHKHDPFIVRGILAPTGTPNDRALFINMEGFFLLEGHAKEHEASAAPGSAATHAHDDPAIVKRPAGEADKKVGGDSEEGKCPGAEEQTEAAKPATDRAPENAAHGAHAHDEHDHANHHPLPEDRREITAVLIRTKGATAGLTLPRAINKGNIAQAALPTAEVAKLFEGILGSLKVLLLVLSVLICVVAGVGILVSIYNSMNDRRREIAVMRALGAGRQTVMAIILLESVLLSVAGGVAGFFLGHGLIGLLSPQIGDQTGVPIGFMHYAPTELWLIPGLIVLAILAGFLPALSAYRTDVAKSLSGSP